LVTGTWRKPCGPACPIPAAFAPVEINGRKLVDGGIARNFPVDVARKRELM
jgi:NTE family protein